MVPSGWLPSAEWEVMDSTEVDTPGPLVKHADPYRWMRRPARRSAPPAKTPANGVRPIRIVSRAERLGRPQERRAHTVIRLPSYDRSRTDQVLYAHASRTSTRIHPGNAGRWSRPHGERDVWLNPPPIPLSTEENSMPSMKRLSPVAASELWGCQYSGLGDDPLLGQHHAGCFGDCTFCFDLPSTRAASSRAFGRSIIREIEEMRDKTRGSPRRSRYWVARPPTCTKLK
jgi:hypothetical protein